MEEKKLRKRIIPVFVHVLPQRGKRMPYHLAGIGYDKKRRHIILRSRNCEIRLIKVDIETVRRHLKILEKY